MKDSFSQYYSELLDFSYDCVDRTVINAYFGRGHSAGGFRHWWNQLEGSEQSLNNTHLMRMAGRFSRRVRGWASAHKTPLIDCRIGDRKHDTAEEYFPSDPNYVGIFVVFVSKAIAPVWKVEHMGKGGIHLEKKLPFINHYSFHIIDPEWGQVTIKMSGQPPFPAQIIFDGHEWVQRRAAKEQVKVTKEDNCFTATSQPQALNRIADSLNCPDSIGRLSEVCDRWIYSACLCFGLDLDDQKRTGFVYSYSTFQLEYSRNLVFVRGSDLDQVYQGLIDRSRTALDVKMSALV